MNDENHAEALRYFQSRMESVSEAMEDSEKLDTLLEDCLCVQSRITLEIQLSAGGPGDGFEIICDATTGEPLHGYHYFVNWGFRKEFPLSNSELSSVCSAYAVEDGRLFLKQGR